MNSVLEHGFQIILFIGEHTYDLEACGGEFQARPLTACLTFNSPVKITRTRKSTLFRFMPRAQGIHRRLGKCQDRS